MKMSVVDPILVVFEDVPGHFHGHFPLFFPQISVKAFADLPFHCYFH